jgi:hypothetical protein
MSLVTIANGIRIVTRLTITRRLRSGGFLIPVAFMSQGNQRKLDPAFNDASKGSDSLTFFGTKKRT